MKSLKHDLPRAADWYIVSDDGMSALRITHGLQLGETESGALVINSSEPAQRWVEFDLSDPGGPLVRLIAADQVMLRDDGCGLEQFLLSYGVTLQLPNNTLYVGADIVTRRGNGPVLRVTDAAERDWDELLGDIRQPEPAAVGTPGVSGSAAVASTRAVVGTQKAAPVPADPVRATPGHGSRSRRSPRGRRRGLRMTLASVLVAALGVAVAVAHQFPDVLNLQPVHAWLNAARLAVMPAPPSLPDPTPLAEAETATEVAAADREVAAEVPEVDDAVSDIQTEVSAVATEHAAAPTVAPAAAPAAVAPAPVGESAADDWRLRRARQLLDEGRITYPPGENAVALLGGLLTDQPGHAAAMAMMGEATNRLLNSAARAHAAGDLYQARNVLEEVFGFNPQNQRARRLWREWVGEER